MTTKRETVLASLAGMLATIFGLLDGDAPVGQFTRDPEATPNDSHAGLVIMRDGDPGQPFITLSPVRYQWDHQAMIEVSASGPDRNATVDAMCATLDAAIIANRTLSGTVIDCRVMEAPTIDEIDGGEGSEVIRAATILVNLNYVSDSPIG